MSILLNHTLLRSYQEENLASQQVLLWVIELRFNSWILKNLKIYLTQQTSYSLEYLPLQYQNFNWSISTKTG